MRYDEVAAAALAAWEKGVRADVDLDRARDEAALGSLARAVAALATDGRFDPRVLLDEGAVAERHLPVLVRWRGELVDRGWLGEAPEDDSRALRWLRPVPTGAEVEAAWDRAESAAPRIGEGRALTGFFRACARHWRALLADEVQVQALLFEDESVTDEIYATNEASRYTNAAAARAALDLTTAAATDGRRPAVWEIGGGTGATTEPVLDAVREVDLTYHFTDVGPWFLDEALVRWGGRAGLSVGVADINDPGMAAALPRPPRGYDVVLAGNVLHNAVDPVATLTAVRALTAVDGTLLMIETVREHAPLLLSMRFLMSPAPGRPGPQDDRARTGRIFLDLPAWETALVTTGWRLEATIPMPDVVASNAVARYGQHLLVARAAVDGAVAA
ncbi:hypothetical protein QE364_001002 [Nocardioides zeae]|uniref:Uncharacterized protein n=1 Tax=Nocardioides zeae TaxID=1457234 RepID=A0ACC6IFC1_9ACTN|nr:class I SAM-dependent methyltransferase [Nocardioides zeae]MDR6174880.1 hypothetical protein [Nocardioides zeae]MDR6209310.1 hypothetical protein [Nocardioides zeae]